jgi:hypothetical protein
LLNLLLHDLGSLHNCSLPDHLLLHQPKSLIFLAKVHQLIFNDGFNLFLRILLVVFQGFDLLVCVLIWSSSVAGDHLLLSRWLTCWVLESSGVDGYIMGLCGCMWVGRVGYLRGWVVGFGGGKYIASGPMG